MNYYVDKEKLEMVAHEMNDKSLALLSGCLTPLSEPQECDEDTVCHTTKLEDKEYFYRCKNHGGNDTYCLNSPQPNHTCSECGGPSHPMKEVCERKPATAEECKCECHNDPIDLEKWANACVHCEQKGKPSDFWKRFDEKCASGYRTDVDIDRSEIKYWLKDELKPLLESLRMEMEPEDPNSYQEHARNKIREDANARLDAVLKELGIL